MSITTVDIGSQSGKFKYILIQLNDQYFIRGDPNLEYHDKIFNKFKQENENKLSSELKVLGGGKIQVDFETKQMNISGESTAFGRADHEKAKILLQEKYPDFNISTDSDKN